MSTLFAKSPVLSRIKNTESSGHSVLEQGSLKNSYIPAAEWQWSGLRILSSNWWPSIVTLTLSLHCWVMCSPHHLTKANIWPKFNKYLSKGSGDMEWTWNSKVKLMTLICDLDLESACLSYRFCTSFILDSRLANLFLEINWLSFVQSTWRVSNLSLYSFDFYVIGDVATSPIT